MVTQRSNTMTSTTTHAVESPAQYIHVSELRLDVKNPRRTVRDTELSQSALLKELYDRFDLEDLLASLANYGYFSEEPLIGVPETEGQVDEPPYIIAEGNRRLAALRILLFKEDREMLKLKQLPAITEVARRRLDPVPVKIYAMRSQVLPYLGVRHIVGVKQWESLAKARYIRELVEDGRSLKAVASQVGSGKRTDVVRRWLLTLYSIEQANSESDVSWDEVDEHFGFSWLYTSLGYRNIRNYLGITNEMFFDPRESPIRENYVNDLLLHMKDLYGPAPGDSGKAVVRESRQIGELAKVYKSSSALAALRSGASLQVALKKTVNEETQLVELLREAASDLITAKGIAPNHKGHKEAAKYARSCQEMARDVAETLDKV